MISRIKKYVKNKKHLKRIILTILKYIRDCISMVKHCWRIFRYTKDKRVYFIGKATHANLGDLAQNVCINKWLMNHYPDYKIIQIETLKTKLFRIMILLILKVNYKPNDFIVFKSGYTFTDLGGKNTALYMETVNMLPQAKIIAMPQTIFFKNKENERKATSIINKAKNMLFLVRDNVSFELAKKMLPNIDIGLFPDIVTSMIGAYEYSDKKKGVLLCCRNDLEKYYSKNEINSLKKKLSEITSVDITDTTKKGNIKKIVKNAEDLIKNEILAYSKYKVVITDRYHGTIFSLIGNTPVVIIKTTDHKVTTGAKWFKGAYDKQVYVATSLDDAFDKSKQYLEENIHFPTGQYYKKNYYDILPEIWNEYLIKND